MASRAVVVVLAIVLACRSARADMMNDTALHAHVDAEIAAGTAHELGHLGFSLGAFVPIFGTVRLDRAMFGDVRPTAIAVDWCLGGAVPVGLGVAAVLDADHRAALAWTAVGLYAATRVAILVVGNLHIREHNRYLRAHLDASGPALAWRF